MRRLIGVLMLIVIIFCGFTVQSFAGSKKTNNDKIAVKKYLVSIGKLDKNRDIVIGKWVKNYTIVHRVVIEGNERSERAVVKKLGNKLELVCDFSELLCHGPYKKKNIPNVMT